MPRTSRFYVTSNRVSRNYSLGLTVGTHPVNDRLGTRLAVVMFVDLWFYNITVRLRDPQNRVAVRGTVPMTAPTPKEN